MAQTLATYANVLKDMYEGAIRETLNSEVPLFKILDESDRPWSGRRVQYPIHTARNSGVGARADGGTLPTAGQQTHQLAVVTSTYQYGRIQVTGPTLKSSKNAFAEAMTVEMEGMVRDLKNDLGRQTWGTGDGRLAQVSTDANSATAISLFNRFAEPGQPGGRYLSAGMLIDFGSVAAPTQDGSSQTVIGVALSSDPATTTDTLTISNSALNVSASDTFVFVQGNGGAGVEILGMQALVDEFTASNYWGSNAFFGATLQNISRQTVSQWNATVLGNSGVARPVDGNLMQKAFDRISIDAGVEPDLIMGEHGVIREFLDSVSSDRRYGTPVFDAGFTNITYNGVKLERDRLAPYNSLLVMKRSTVKMYTLMDFSWADLDGSILSRVASADAYEAYMAAYKNLGLDENPKQAVFIRDIQVNA